jgi:long-chain acyl-CoA synthetase
LGRTLFTELRAACARCPDGEAILFRGQTLSRGQLLDRVEACAAWLAEQPAGPVAIALPDSPDLLVAFFAAAALGRPALVLDVQMSAADRRDVIARAAAGVVIDRPLPPHPGRIALPCVASEAEFYFGLTSGTTGPAKIFARNHASWLATFDAAQTVFGFGAQDRIAIIGSLSHSLFLYGAVHALCAGLPVILSAPFRPGRARREIAAHGATVLYCVPAMLEPLAGGLALAGVRLIISGGAPLPSHQRALVKACAPSASVIETYGASELSYVACLAVEQGRSGSAYRAFPGVEIDIRSADGERQPAGTPGHVWVRSPMVFSRYLGPEGRAPASRDGWASVGDIGVLSESGGLRIHGRANRTMNTKGLKIRPEPAEDALASHDGVVQAVVLGLPDARRGEQIAAVIVAHEGAVLSRAQLRAFCRDKLGARAAPQIFFQTLGLPMTRSGKVAIARLRAALSRGDPAYVEVP